MFNDDLRYVLNNKLVIDLRNAIEEIEDMLKEIQGKLDYSKDMLDRLDENARLEREDGLRQFRGEEKAL
jgi:Ni,Fe-hydrogenase III large subunit